jgi:hypothetical protein
MAPSHAPVGRADRPVLLAIEKRLKTAPYIDRTLLTTKHGKPTLTAWFDLDFFPAAVEEAYYDIRWYTSGNFEIHYQENRENGHWCRRWDRHPRDRSRDHYHPPPDAGHPPEPENYPETHYEVLRTIDTETLTHLENHPLFSTE